MPKFTWKTLGLVVAAAVGAQVASMTGATALTLPVVPSLSDVGEWDGQLQQVAHRHYRHPRYHGRHRHWRHRHYRHRRPGYRHYYGGWWYANPWWLMPVPQPAPNYGGSPHVNWCLSKYRSYNPATDMYLGYDGYYHRCISPY